MSICRRSFCRTSLLLVLTLLAASRAQAGVAVAIDFDGPAPGLGALPGGADPRVAGNGQWWVPDNAATFGVVTAGIGLDGSNGLVIGNRGNGGDGVIDNVKSPRLAESSGETGTNSGGTGTVTSNNRFTSSYWFRTASETAVNQFRFRSEIYGPDRTTFFGVNGDTTSLDAFASGINESGDFVQTNIASNLAWGEWYQLVTTIDFVDGGAANDIVHYALYDSANVLKGAITTTTWEEGARQLGYNGGNVFAVDAVQFTARGAVMDNVAYVDNLTFGVTSTPEPASLAIWSVMGLVSLGAARRRSRRTA